MDEQIIRYAVIYGDCHYKYFVRKWYNPMRLFKGDIGVKVIPPSKLYKI